MNQLFTFTYFPDRYRQTLLLALAIGLLVTHVAIAQTNVWTPKANLGTGGRYAPTGFSIGTKGYVGLGYDAAFTLKADFWEYDPSTNAWTQKADFGGGARSSAVGFGIGTKGYIGTGSDGNNDRTDFWEYNPSTNVWTQKADFSSTARAGAVGFSIGTKGYVGTGSASGSLLSDFWEYDPSTNSWTQKANFGGGARSGAVGFSLGTKGYIGTGGSGNGVLSSDFWEYDPSTNAWTQKASFGGAARGFAVGFGIGTKGYVGTGGSTSNFADFWEYDQTADSWTQKANVTGPGRANAIGFAIGAQGYIGGGYNDSFTFLTDFYEYVPSPALPVTLRYFNGRMTDAGALLGWATATEHNNAYFLLERSRDLIGFEAIATLPSQAVGGNSALPFTYSFTDTQPLPGVTYYRLTQVDKNGTRTLGRPIALSKENQPPVLYPNPLGTLGEATLEPALAYRSYEVVDMQGRVVQQSAISGTLSRLSVGTLPTGVYLLRVQTEGGGRQVFRLLR